MLAGRIRLAVFAALSFLVQSNRLKLRLFGLIIDFAYLLCGELLAAEWAEIVALEPFLDAFRVEVVVYVARERRYVIIWTKLAHAD